jgi:hypothetical protein
LSAEQHEQEWDVSGEADQPIPLPGADDLAGWCRWLQNNAPEKLEFMTTKRGLTPATLEQFKIGWDGKRYTIPMYEAGALVNVRRYDPNNTKGMKMMPWGKGHGKARLYVAGDLAKATSVAICEGELDAIKYHQETGMCAVSGTGGAGHWKDEWSPLFVGKHVAILYDNDAAGRKGAGKVAKSLRRAGAKSVRLPLLTVLAPGEDVTDWYVTARFTTELLRRVINNTEALPTLSTLLTRPWPVLGHEAYYGLAGKVVKTLAPQTEADPVGLLCTLLTVFGSALGPNTYAYAASSQHPARLNTILVGDTSRARKGTSQAEVNYFWRMVESPWDPLRGLASGEGLIQYLQKITPESGPDDDDDDVVVVERPPPLLVVEEEFSKLLAVSGKEGSTLSQIVRELYDRGDADIPTRHRPLRVRGAHVSVIGHITEEELQTKLTSTDVANGFANRFGIACVKRARLLPHGGQHDESALRALARQVEARLQAARGAGQLKRTPDADAVWEAAYRRWAESPAGGLVGALTARVEAQALRYSVAYAAGVVGGVISAAPVPEPVALVDFHEASAKYLYGEQTGDPVADRLLAGLRGEYPDWVDGTKQADLFSGHVKADALAAARAKLEGMGLAETKKEQTDGRPRILTRATWWG